MHTHTLWKNSGSDLLISKLIFLSNIHSCGSSVGGRLLHVTILTFMVSQVTTFHCISRDTFNSTKNRVLKELFTNCFMNLKEGALRGPSLASFLDNYLAIFSI